jgi:hypothetical protein
MRDAEATSGRVWIEMLARLRQNARATRPQGSRGARQRGNERLAGQDGRVIEVNMLTSSNTIDRPQAAGVSICGGPVGSLKRPGRTPQPAFRCSRQVPELECASERSPSEQHAVPGAMTFETFRLKATGFNLEQRKICVG